VQATVGSHCVDCAKAARPDVATRAKLASSSVLAPATIGLIVVNVLVFVVGAVRDGAGLSGNSITAMQADLGVSKAILQGRTGFDGIPIPAHEWYRLATAGFVHFGIFHIAMNMLLLYQLGNLLERVIGSARLLLLYAAGLFAGSLGVLVADSIGSQQGGGITGGASGAVFGLMAAAAIGMHRRGINVFRTGIGTTLMLNLVLTFAITGVSVGGHLGGLVGGLLCGFVLFAPPWRPMPKWAGWIAPVAVIVVAIAGSVLITL
jgi:membrane associated rhomboid family serine protease